jgi:hypothetical protein
MTNVIDIDTRKLRPAHFACGERMGDGSWPVVTECWTTYPLDEVLRDEHRPKFLAELAHFAKPGDRLEIFRVSDIEKPEADPLEMARVTVTHFESSRRGLQMQTKLDPYVLYFGSGSPTGIEERPWRGKQCVFQDGKRVGAFNTLLESIEFAEKLRGSNRVDARFAELRNPAPPGVSLPRTSRCRHDDIALAGPRKLSRVLQVRCLDPIGDIIADPQYWRMVKDRFRTGDRVTILRFANDRYSEGNAPIVEVLDFALADVSGGRVHFYPQRPISKTDHAADTGYVIDKVGKRFTIRQDGRTIESLATRDEVGWWLTDKGVEAIETKAA